MEALLATVLQLPVPGSQISLVLTRSAGFTRSPATPPVTSTSPVGNSVALWFQRAVASEPVQVHWGFVWLRSMTSAVFVGRVDPLPPPTYMILPGSYITAVP